MSKADELVLCVPRGAVEYFLGFTELPTGVIPGQNNTNVLERILDERDWVRRGDDANPGCENDPKLKQIIPYIIVLWNGMYLRYRRMKSSGEQRLAGLASIGIGGHINKEDLDGIGKCNLARLCDAARRELNEEIELSDKEPEFSFLGFVNNEDNEVGRVHFGVLLLTSFSRSVVFQEKCPDVGRLELVSLDALRRDVNSFEKWSQLVIHSNILETPKPRNVGFATSDSDFDAD